MNSIIDPILAPKQHTALLQKTLKILQSPINDQEGENEEAILSVLRIVPFFEKIIESPICLEDFLQLAKFYFHYEVYSFGTALIKEKGYANKFCIILDGKAQKMTQRPYNEVENEMRERNAMIAQQKRNDGLSSPQNSTKGLKKVSSLKGLHETFASSSRHLIGKTSIDLPTSSFKSQQSRHNISTSSTRRLGVLRDKSMQMQRNESFNTINKSSFTRDRGSSIDEIKSSKSSHNLIRHITRNALEIPSLKYIDQGEEPVLAQVLHRQAYKQGSRKLRVPEGRKNSVNEKPSSLDNIMISPEQQNLVQQVVAKNPDIRDRCMLGEIIRIMKIKTYQPGQFFGENFYKLYQPKENSLIAVSSPELHLLTLTREDYKAMIIELHKRSSERIKVFSDLFPSMEDEDLNKFSRYFTHRHYKKGDVIYSQNERARELYLLQDGDVRLVKEMEPLQSSPSWIGQPLSHNHNSPLAPVKAPRKTELPIAGILHGQFFGEELLLAKNERQYTAIVNSQDCDVYLLHISRYEKITTEFPFLMKMLGEQANERFAWRQERASALTNIQKNKIMTKPLSINNLASPQRRISTSFGVSKRGETLNTTVKDHTTVGSEVDLDTIDSDCFRGMRNLDREFVNHLSPQTRSSTIYRNKFSRKLKVAISPGSDNSILPSRKDSSEERPTSIFGFNLIQEFKETKPRLAKLNGQASNHDNISLVKKVSEPHVHGQAHVPTQVPLKTRHKSSSVGSLAFVNVTSKIQKQISPASSKDKDYMSIVGNLDKVYHTGMIGKPRIKTLLQTVFTKSRQNSPKKPAEEEV